MMSQSRWTSGICVAVLSVVSGFVHADTQDDAIRIKCPAAQAWIDAKGAGIGAARQKEDKTGTFSDTALREDIHARYVSDQADRNAWIAAKGAPDAARRMTGGDTERLAWMKPRFLEKGFPTAARVGPRGVSEAFILVQHADQDLAFQKAMLPGIRQAATNGEVDRGDVAMLVDRILRAQKKPQRYGTQYDFGSNGMRAMTLQPTEDIAHLDARRASMDLLPRKDYECMLRVVYAPAEAAP